jgi:O-antigen ligase
MMVTFSRGAYLAFGLGVLGLTYFKKKRLAIAATAILVLVVLNPWLLPSGIRYRLDKTYEGDAKLLGEGGSVTEENLDKSAETRLVIWRGGLEMVRDHPFVGVGLGQFASNITAYAELPRNRDAHNAYLIIAAEIGIPGLLLFLIAVASLFWVTRRVYRRHPDHFVRATALGYLGGLSALLMANMFGSRVNTMETAGYVWVLAALMARADLDLGKSRSRPSSKLRYSVLT